jgi:Na+-transporting NADH:ubiquinone oxidoreductase subunit D
MSLKKQLKDTTWFSNPVAYQVLGICSALAVTVQLENSIVMSIALTSVLIGSNVTISLLRNAIPRRIRIIIQLAVVSTLVIVVDQLLQAFLYDISKQLSVFVGLIITNCIVLGRAEAFAMANPPMPSFWDAVGNGIGYAWVLILIGGAREILGKGAILGFKIVPQFVYDIGYVNNGLMVLAPAAFIMLGLLIWASKALGGAQGAK